MLYYYSSVNVRKTSKRSILTVTKRRENFKPFTCWISMKIARCYSLLNTPHSLVNYGRFIVTIIPVSLCQNYDRLCDRNDIFEVQL